MESQDEDPYSEEAINAENTKREAIINALNENRNGIMVRNQQTNKVGKMTSTNGNVGTGEPRKYFFDGKEVSVLDLGDFTIVSTTAAAAAGRRRRKTRKSRKTRRHRKTRRA
jgi:hypothetical protein